MKLEYLDDISDGGKFPGADPNQLIRLYDFDHLEMRELCRSLRDFVVDRGPLNLNSLSIINPVNCNLILSVSNENKGINSTDKQNFYCDLTTDTYRQMIILLEPFCIKNATGYQWLYDLNTETDFLVSKGGSW
jgi:hypothetical protein